MKKKLYKSSSDKMLSGVLAGIAEYFDIDPTLIRLGYVVLSVFTTGFPGLIAYIIMAIVVPKRPENEPPYGNNNPYNQQPPYYGGYDAQNQQPPYQNGYPGENGQNNQQ